MAISVSTRAAKGSPLSYIELDDNFNDLAVSATNTNEGNTRLATQGEADGLTDITTAISPGVLTSPVNALIELAVSERALKGVSLFSGWVNTGTHAMSDWTVYGAITIWFQHQNGYVTPVTVPTAALGGRGITVESSPTSIAITLGTSTSFTVLGGPYHTSNRISDITGLRVL